MDPSGRMALAGLLIMVANAASVFGQQPGRWRITGSLATWNGPENGLWAPTATLLKNGNVLVVGGNGAEVYDPETFRWASTGNLITPRYAISQSGWRMARSWWRGATI